MNPRSKLADISFLAGVCVMTLGVLRGVSLLILKLDIMPLPPGTAWHYFLIGLILTQVSIVFVDRSLLRRIKVAFGVLCVDCILIAACKGIGSLVGLPVLFPPGSGWVYFIAGIVVSFLSVIIIGVTGGRHEQTRNDLDK